MNQNLIPPNAFIDPKGQNQAEVKQLMNAVVNLVISHSSSASERSPLPESSEPCYGKIPEQGVPTDELLKKLKTILEDSMNPSHPQYIGHMDSIPTLISCLGEFVSTSVNNNMLSLEMSPVFSRMESQVVQTIAKLFGYDENAGGVMLSGGSLANLQGLTVARNQMLSVQQDGMVGIDEQPVILASEEAHTSLQKVAMILGIGVSAIIPVKTDNNSQMDASDLERQIKTAIDQRKKPFAVVATAGTTVTGNIDPITAVSEVAQKYGLWLHVDAAYGGALIFSAKNRYRLDGIEKADSITFNPQK